MAIGLFQPQQLEIPDYVAAKQAGVESRLHEAQLQKYERENQRNRSIDQLSQLSLSKDPRAGEAMNALAAVDPERAKKNFDYHYSRSERAASYAQAQLGTKAAEQKENWPRLLEMAKNDPLIDKKDLDTFPNVWTPDTAKRLQILVQSHRKIEDAIKAPEQALDLEAKQANIAKTKADTAKTYSDIGKTKAELGGFIKPEEKFKNTTALRNDYLGNSKVFQGVREGHERVIASSQDPSPAGDLSLIFGYMKALDPNSTVREGEFAQAAKSGSLGDKIQNSYNQIASGKRLTASQRKDFVDRSQKLYDQAEKSQTKTVDQYKKIAQRNGLNPEDVIIDFNTTAKKEPEITPIPEQFKSAPLDALLAEQARRSGGRKQ